jgi:hypothetical protein
MPTKLDYKYVYNFIKTKNCTLKSEEYLNNAQPLIIKCQCGKEFITTFMRFRQLDKSCCNDCSRHNYSIDFVREYIKGFGCVLLDTSYSNSNQELSLTCSCGVNFQTTFSKFKNRNKTTCNQCSIGRENNSHLTLEEVVDYLESKSLKLLSDYTSCANKIKLLCPCTEIFETSFNKVKSSNKIRCNKCTKSMSKIEILSKEFLNKNQINFKSQFKFPDLKTINNVCLRFDFAIFDDNNNIMFLLELDGQQHFKSYGIFGGEEQFEIRKRNDDMKNVYCKSKNIKLIRIPYWKFNKINEELTEILKIC